MSASARVASLVTALCSDACAGRRTGSPGGKLAREHVRAAFQEAGLPVTEQRIPNGGANLVVTLDGAGPLADRTVIVGAHYDHLGVGSRGEVYRGADDNAAAVAALVEAARVAAGAPGDRRRLVFVAFDAEEPPYFGGGAMGSEVYAASDAAGLDAIDAMVALDLVGHALGPAPLPDAVRQSLFVLGTEKGEGLAALVDAREGRTPGLAVRRLDAEIIPPLSDYDAFWRREIPFAFLTCGRSSVYHTPEDTPDRVDLAKLVATAGFLGDFALDLAAHAPRARFRAGHRDDAATLGSIAALARELVPFSPAAQAALVAAERWLAAKRPLTTGERATVAALVGRLESALA